MKTIEELKGMTQDELVVLAQELQEQAKKSNEFESYWYKKYTEVQKKYESVMNVIKGVIDLSQ